MFENTLVVFRRPNVVDPTNGARLNRMASLGAVEVPLRGHDESSRLEMMRRLTELIRARASLVLEADPGDDVALKDDFVDSLALLTSTMMKSWARDLDAFSNHAKRKAIVKEDVALLGTLASIPSSSRSRSLFRRRQGARTRTSRRN